jgi:predicted outer membrane repeat protein
MKNLFISSALIIISLSSIALTHIPAGNVSGTWTYANSPYIIDGNITIQTSNLLTIEPGVQVKFSGHYNFLIYGRLLAIGSISDTIVFSVTDTTGFPNHVGWNGLRFLNTETNGQDSSIIKFCKIEFGYANGTGGYWDGGGLYSRYSNLCILNSSFVRNRATYSGGAIYILDTNSFSISNVDILYNIINTGSTSHGTGIYLATDYLSLENINVIGNTKSGTSNQTGSIYLNSCKNTQITNLNVLNNNFYGIWSYYSDTLEINNFTICNGTIGFYGYNHKQIILNNGNVYGNSSYGIYLYLGNKSILTNVHTNNNSGGGISFISTNGSLQLLNVTANDNSLVGISINNGSEVYFEGVTVNNNPAQGIEISNCRNFYAVNTSVTNNFTVNEGGGIGISNGSIVRLNNCTISNNLSFTFGGGIYCSESISVLKNCIIYNNYPQSIYVDPVGGGGIMITYSDILGGWNGVGNMDINPIFIDPDNGDFQLSEPSPCIDMGDPGSPLDPDGTRADMGAYYYAHTSPTSVYPVITSIIDVPNDQGKQVVINWDRSSVDDPLYQGINRYSIWREQDWADNPWELMGYVGAQFFEEYSYIAPTIFDSTSQGLPYFKFKISAETNNPMIHFISLPDSGYSVDNLAPLSPELLSAILVANHVDLKWEKCNNIDFHYYAIYRSNNPDHFPAEPYAFTNDTLLTDMDLLNDTIYYVVTAFDYAGNESDYSNIASVELPIITLDIKVLLQGPYDSGELQTSLNLSGNIPFTQPYSNSPWNYYGDEYFSSIPNPDIVDWVLIELRNATDVSLANELTTLAKRASFILKSGNLVDIDGSSNVRIGAVYNDNLYLVIHHRNHLAVITNFPLTESNGVYSYDFTTSVDQAFGGSSAQNQIDFSIWGMISGDANADRVVDLNDKNLWTTQTGQSDYLSGDLNMDSQVNNNDKNDKWLSNLGKSSQVPE